MRYNNPLGFSKQTEVLIQGVGGHNLIKEFKKRDISTDVLHKLIKEDFIQLGADEELANKMVYALHIPKEKDLSMKPYQRIFNKIKILDIGNKQLNIIQACIIYYRYKLTKKRINSIIEPDKALSASKVLCLAADSILKEVNEAELKLKELEAVIIVPRGRKFYVSYCISVGGLCIASYILFNRFWK